MLFRDTLPVVLDGNVGLFLDELVVGHPRMVGIVNQRRENNSELRKWIGAEAERAIVNGPSDGPAAIPSTHFAIVDLLWVDDALHELASGHRNVTCMLEVVERDVSVHGGNTRDVVVELALYQRTELSPESSLVHT